MENFGRDVGRLLTCLMIALCVVVGVACGLGITLWIKS